MSIQPVYGNASYTSVVNTTTEGSALIQGVKELSPFLGKVVHYPDQTTAVTPTGSAGTVLTDDQLLEAFNGGPLGLGLLVNTSGAGFLALAAADTAANALHVQTVLGLNYVGACCLLQFYWLDAPGGDVGLKPVAGTYFDVEVLGTTDLAILFPGAAVENAPAINTAKVIVRATNVTSGSEAISSNIIQTCSLVSIT